MNTLKSLFLRPLALLSFLFMACLPLRADTLVSGTISTGTTWTLAGSPYIVTGNVTVQNNAAPVPVLTIEPGVLVKFNANTSLFVGLNYPGELQAVGTATQPITFTANSASPTAGFWQRIWFGASATATSRIAYATVAFGVWGIGVSFSAPRIENTTVQNCSTAGILVSGVGASPVIAGSTVTANVRGITASNRSSPSLQTVTISNNTSFPITVDPTVTLGSVSALTVIGNGTDAVEMGSGNVQANATWKNIGLPYIVTGAVYVPNYSGSPVVLTIEAGLTIKFNAGTTLSVGSGLTGSELQAVGTPTQPIIFTANSTTPTAGFWRGIQFASLTTSTSRLAYATVSYGGLAGISGGLDINLSSPTIQNVTVQNSLHSGISVSGGSPTISGSTLTANPWGLWYQPATASTLSVINTTISANTLGGISVLRSPFAPPPSPSLQGVTISNNGGFAISADAKVTFGTVSALTVSGNGTDALELRTDVAVDIDTTWKKIGLTYVVTTDVSVDFATLTIEPGVTLKFGAGKSLTIGPRGVQYPSGLQAVGTAADPIVFTANSATPGPGFWNGITFHLGTTSTAQLAYATVSYAGYAGFPSFGGIQIWGSSPTIRNTTVQNCAYSGISVRGSPGVASPLIAASTLTANPVGLVVSAPSSPSLQTVSFLSNTGAAASFDPTVTLGAVSGLTVTGNGTNGIEIQPGYVNVTTTWKDTGLPYVVRSLVLVEGSSAILTIDAGVTAKFDLPGSLVVGAGGPGELRAVGTPALPITFTANTTTPTAGSWGGIRFSLYAALTSVVAYATVAYAGTPSLNFGGIHASNASPTIDHVTLTANAYAGVSTASGASPIITNCNFTGNTAGIVNLTPASIVSARLNWWDSASGPSGAGPGLGQSVSAGVTFEPWLAGPGSAPQFVSSLTRYNRTFNPTNENSAVIFGTTLSGNWTLKIIRGLDIIRTFTGSGPAGTLDWDGRDGSGAPQPDGTYFYQIESTTLAGEAAAPARGQAIINSTLPVFANFSASQAGVQIDSTAAGTVTYTSTVPFTLTETLVVKNSIGQVVRTVVNNAVRPRGTYTDVWDGRNDAGGVLPDGGYFYVATVTRGADSLTWDRSGDMRSVFATVSYPTTAAAFDPFNNVPLVISYTSPESYRTSVQVVPYEPVTTVCADIAALGGRCLTEWEYEAAGVAYSVVWAGTGPAGDVLPDQQFVRVVQRLDNYPVNAVALFGTRPRLTNAEFVPTVYGPTTGAQTLRFNLSTYLSQAVTLTVKFLNQGSLSVLRTISVLGQAPGLVALTWDGRADNGMRVAPGGYTAIIRATDAVGNSVALHALTTVMY